MANLFSDAAFDAMEKNQTMAQYWRSIANKTLGPDEASEISDVVRSVRPTEVGFDDETVKALREIGEGPTGAGPRARPWIGKGGLENPADEVLKTRPTVKLGPGMAPEPFIPDQTPRVPAPPMSKAGVVPRAWQTGRPTIPLDIGTVELPAGLSPADFDDIALPGEKAVVNAIERQAAQRGGKALLGKLAKLGGVARKFGGPVLGAAAIPAGIAAEIKWGPELAAGEHEVLAAREQLKAFNSLDPAMQKQIIAWDEQGYTPDMVLEEAIMNGGAIDPQLLLAYEDFDQMLMSPGLPAAYEGMQYEQGETLSPVDPTPDVFQSLVEMMRPAEEEEEEEDMTFSVESMRK